MEHFIETVRKYPCLWNTTAIEYRDQELKDAAWTEVMKETDLASVKEVKLKWKKLRDSYRDALKRQSETLARDPGAGAAAAKRGYPWKYMGAMQFLQPHMSVRKKPADSPPAARANGHGEPADRDRDAASSSDSDSEPGTPDDRDAGSARLAGIDRKLDFLCQARKRPRLAPAAAPTAPAASASAAAASAAQPDPLDTFFSGMCQSTKRLPYPAQIKIKKTLFAAVIAAEEALLQPGFAGLWRGAASSGSSDANDNDSDDQKPA